MTDIAIQLERLGLQQYHDALVGEGFDTWETLLDVQETDLDALGVKLGHRRKLQRAIAEYRGLSSDRPLGSPSQEGTSESTRSGEVGSQTGLGKEAQPSTIPEQKRKYRRHPKPDENAPEKPPSAYVIFSNQVREEVKGDNLSFTEIARLVGERWQKLDASEKEPFDSKAATQKENYLARLAEYKKTDAYRDYLQYLADFKAKHGQTTESKRPKLDLQQSSSSLSGYGPDTDTVLPEARHTRGGSLGSISTVSHGAPLPSPAGTALTPVSSLPNLNTSGIRQLGIGARGSTPPHFQLELRMPGHVSSQSSVSEESAVMRPEQLDPLPRTATLSLSTPPAVTPPLPSSASVGGRSDHGTSSETVPWTQRHPHSSQAFINATSASPSSRIPMSIPPIGSGNGEAWRERLAEPNRQILPPHSSLPISHLLASDHGSELSQAQRTLPPLRRLPSGPNAPPGHQQSSSSFHTGARFDPIPGQLEQTPPAGTRTETEAAAASVLAGLARRPPGQASSESSEHRR